MNSYIIASWIFWMIIGGLIGALIGQVKGRTVAGFWWGFFLWIIGWCIIALGPNYKLKCPKCGGIIPEHVSKCKHCGSELGENKAYDKWV